MYYFLGNCQADFVGEVMKRRNHSISYKVLASPLTHPSHPGLIHSELLDLEIDLGLEPYYHGRTLDNQFDPILVDDTKPELVVLSLFHENVPLFVHNDMGYVFYVDAKALNDHERFMQWAKANCRMFKPNPATYLDRYRTMLEQIRKDVPGVPIIVLNRLSHFPAFGPDPYSYLEGWETLWPKAEVTLKEWTATFPDVHILEMNRVFGGIWNQSKHSIESYCPFLKIDLEETDGQVTGLHARRDIEHVGPLPERLADKIEKFLETGSISYEEDETIPIAWRRQWSPSKLDEDVMLAKLQSGANYQSAEAVASFFLDLSRDFTALLVQAKEFMPICHNTLHMIKQYGRIFQNPTLADWCDAHVEKARDFTANGPLYQEDYINRVLDIKSHARGQ